MRVTASSRGVVLDNDGMTLRRALLVSRASVSVGQRRVFMLEDTDATVAHAIDILGMLYWVVCSVVLD